MELLQALMLGIVQGLTEFLPVSSTGHLLLAEWVMGLDTERFGLPFDAALHLGTLGGVLAVFWRDFLEMARGLLAGVRGKAVAGNPAARQALALVLGTVPAVLAGLLLEQTIETTLRSPLVVAAMLALFGGVLLWVERAGGQRRPLGDLRWRDALLIGSAQALALVPGVSRSGVTIAAGMALGLRRDASARFTFLLSAPIVAGAGSKQLLDVVQETGLGSLDVLAVGMVSAGVVGYLVIRFLLRFLAAHPLDIFAFYRFVLAAAVAVAFFAFGTQG
ncbi:MAG: undecaprenyl-diphosphatase UppP [Chloroflexi bacterium]|nr:undecaprenyl-diphosphatase UppP [Chloroflexota bacterium]